MSIRIIIADDHQIVRQGLKLLLEKESDMEVVGEAEDGRRTVTLAKDLTPDIVLMDVKMPEMNGIEASYQILSEFPNVNVIALSMYSDRRFVLDMLKAGARGYLLKDCAFEELAQAIRLVMAKKTYLSPGIAEIVVKDFVTHDAGAKQSVFSALTPREGEVLQMIAEGKRTGQIADLLRISKKTVDTHRQQIMFKLKTRSVAELTKFAIREGLIALDD
ncbi:MAG: response regulator transcription factor [Syntrophobacterales bacterium]|jgi:DNA-binding NarL/FixJ family response regulator